MFTVQQRPQDSGPIVEETMASASPRLKVIYGLGSVITSDDAIITGSRLPTCRQILRCFLFHQNNPTQKNQTQKDSARSVLEKLLPFYGKANIPVITNKKAEEKIIRLADKNAKLREIPIKRRDSDNAKSKVAREEEELNKTFCIWPNNVEELVKNEEDLIFLESMKTNRVASFGNLDTNMRGVQQRRENREEQRRDRELREREKDEHRYVVSKPSTSAASETCTTSETESEEEDTELPKKIRKMREDDAEFIIRKPSGIKPKPRKGTEAYVPVDILKTPKLTSLATRMKMTSTQQAVYTEAMIEEIGGDKDKVWTSYAFTDKQRRVVNSVTAANERESWEPPKYASLHWDSKMLSTLTNKYETEERLTIAIGTEDEIKLLGVPSYTPGTDQHAGDIITQKVAQLLSDWDCADSIVNMTFDTTSANTGHVTAACVSIQSRLDKALLWSGCRHHVGEVILSHVFEDLKIEASKSPEVSVFQRFRKHYGMIPNTPLRCLDMTDFSEDGKLLAEELRVGALLQSSQDHDFRRDDYRELIELSIMFLKGNTNKQFTFKKPGALHKARWMAKLLYGIKICLFEEQINSLPQGTVTTKQQVPKIRAFVNFITLVYVPWWLKSSHTANAPYSDLDLYVKLVDYNKINPTISTSAVKAFNRQLWYLTSEMIPLSLFSNLVDNTEKELISKQLLEVKDENAEIPSDRFGTGYGKPKFPELEVDKINDIKLSDMIDGDSWLIFRLLDIDDVFLEMPVNLWTDNNSYQQAKNRIRGINCVNDCAERGVKLSSDFLASAKTEQHYQNVLQVVEKDRKVRPNLRKRATQS